MGDGSCGRGPQSGTDLKQQLLLQNNKHSHGGSSTQSGDVQKTT